MWVSSAARYSAGVVLVLLAGHVSAQVASPDDEHLKRLKAYQTIQPYGEKPFGEEINLYTGELSFNHTDIALEGSGPAIRVSRERSGNEFYDESMAMAFGSWRLALPRIETLVAAPRYGLGTPQTNWRLSYAISAASLARCSSFSEPYMGQGGIPLEEWWHGYELVNDDGARQLLLKRDASYTAKPAMAGEFPIVTLSNWQITCLPQPSNGTVEDGEAFLAVAPDGTKYWFDYLVGAPASEVNQFDHDSGAVLIQKRMQVAMLVSRIEDRFGNAVTFAYDGDKIQSIQGSDGRVVSIVWRSDSRLIDQIIVQPGSATPRTWRYEYTSGALSAVVLPDTSRWTFNIGAIGGSGHQAAGVDTNGCDEGRSAPGPGAPVTSTITAPSGLVGTFVTQPIWHGRSYVGSYCVVNPGESHESVPPFYSTFSLVQKTTSGPGLTSQTWQYSYPVAVGSTAHDACAASGTCTETVWVDIQDPNGHKTRYTSSNRWGVYEGKLVKTERFASTGSAVNTETLTYNAPNAGPYPVRIGASMLGFGANEAKAESWTPLRQKQTTQQGRAFTWQVATNCTPVAICFDTFARPTKVIKSSAPAP